MKIALSTALILLSALTSFAAIPLTTTGGEIKFTATGKPGFLKINGTANSGLLVNSLKLENGTAFGEFEFNLKKLDTGIELRNEHMKDKYLEVAKYPSAKLTLKPVSFTEVELKSDVKKAFNGTLQLHGVSKDISGQFEYSAKNKNILATFNIKVSDFNIDIPKYMGIVVSENVDVSTQLNLK